MYSQRLSKEKAHIKVPSTRRAITSPSPIESIHSSTSTHSSNTLSPTISNTSSNDHQSSSIDSSSTGSRSRSSSTDISNNDMDKYKYHTMKQEQRTQKVIKNEPKNRYRTERRRKLSDPHSFPLLYECYAQARVRIKYELSSQHLTDLPAGSIVTVEEIKDRRARISAPIHGWLSVTSKDGNTILMVLNKQTAKIGGKVMFNYNYQHQHQHRNNIPITAKIIDYNQNYDMHKVQHKNGKNEWINLKDKNITYIPNGVPSMVNPIKHTEKFFLQFFMKDYPKFVPKQQSASSLSYNHYQSISQQSRAEQLRQAQILHQLHHKQMQQRNEQNKYSKSGQFKLNGHNHGSASYSKHSHSHSQHGHNQKILHQMINNNNHRSHPNGIDKNQNGNRCYKQYNNNNNKMRYNALNTMKALNATTNSDQNKKRKVECKDDIKENNRDNMDHNKENVRPSNANPTKRKTDPEEFRRKIKEIEKKIIDHLHKRGYYEDSKEFWIYIRKAKEMAIEKAKKERDRYLAREQREKAEAEAREKLNNNDNDNGN